MWRARSAGSGAATSSRSRTVASLAELNELIAAGDRLDDDRVITGRPITIGAAFAAEASALMGLPGEAFDRARLLHARVDNRARVSVRQCFYSVPARYAGRRLPVRLAARTVEVLDGPTLVARHERAVGRYVEVLTLDHYLEVLKTKPGALPGATALAQAKACGAFTASHQAYWDAARRARGDAAGTRALIEILLAHRSMPAAALTAAMDRAVTSGCLDPEMVLIDARRDTSAPRTRGPDRRAGPLRPTATISDRLRRPTHRERIMTTTPKPATVDAAAQASIGAAARELHLPTVRTEAVRLAEIADRERQTHLRYLAEVLAAEVDDRTERRRTRRINDAKFPRLKRLADFNIDAVPTIAPATLGQLAAGHYMDAGEPVVLLGDSGTGKSHLLIGLGLAACEQGRRVRYITTAQLVNELVEAADERLLSRVVGPLRPPGSALPRRTRLRPNRPTRRRTALPDHHRTRRTSLHRDRHQPALQRMGNRLPRPPPGRRHRRPRHLQRPHPRDRHPVLPATHQQDHHPTQTSQLTRWGQNSCRPLGPNHLTKRTGQEPNLGVGGFDQSLGEAVVEGGVDGLAVAHDAAGQLDEDRDAAAPRPGDPPVQGLLAFLAFD